MDAKVKLGIWAGSSPAPKESFNKGLARIKKLQIETVIPKEVIKNGCKGLNKTFPFLAGSDADKINSLLMLVNSPVRDIFCTRGGYGTLRLLPLLDGIDLSQTTPKRIWGFSDYTALQHYFFNRYGWKWVHSPMLTGSSLQKPSPVEKKGWPVPFGLGSKTEHKVKIHVAPEFQNSRALLLGGNLASLVCLMGTAWEPTPQEKFFLFLEDVSEAGRFVDRYLHQLYYSKFFKNCIGILTGHFTDSPGGEKICFEFCKSKNIPCFSGVLAGHESPNIPLPMGDVVELTRVAKNSARLTVPELTFGW